MSCSRCISISGHIHRARAEECDSLLMALSQRDRSLDTAIIMISMSVPPYQHTNSVASADIHTLTSSAYSPMKSDCGSKDGLHTANISSWGSNSVTAPLTPVVPCQLKCPGRVTSGPSPLIPSRQHRILSKGYFDTDEAAIYNIFLFLVGVLAAFSILPSQHSHTFLPIYLTIHRQCSLEGLQAEAKRWNIATIEPQTFSLTTENKSCPSGWRINPDLWVNTCNRSSGLLKMQ